MGAVVAGAVVAVGVASVVLAEKFQSATASIAIAAGIPIAAAQKIGAAFQTTIGTTEFSAITLANAYAGVAGQLGEMQGKALTASQALAFMKTTSDLAEASGESLGAATTTLTNVMQAFQIPVKDASSASNELFNTSRLTGVGLDSLGSTVDKLKAKLGVAAPTLGDLGTLLVDLQNHGVQGARGLMVVNTAMTTLLKSADTVAPAVAKTVDAATTKATASSAALAKAQTSLSQKQAELAGKTSLTVTQQISLTNATTAVTDATQKNTAAQAALTVAQNGLSPTLSATVAGAQQLGLNVFDASGKFVGMGSVIAQLQPKLAGLTQQQQLQALATVFGTTANKALLATVLAGPAAYNAAAAAANKTGTAHAAAAKQAATLKVTIETMKATLSDLGVKLGQVLLPTITKLATFLAKLANEFLHNKTAMEVVGAIIGGVLVTALGALAVAVGGVVLSVAPFIIAIAAIALAAIELKEHWAEVWGEVKRIFDDVSHFLTSGFGTLALLIVGGPLIGGLIVLALHWREVWDGMRDVFDPLRDAVEDTWNVISDIFSTAFGVIDAVVKFFWPAIVGYFRAYFDMIKGITTAAFDIIKAVFKVAFGAITVVVRTAFDLIKAAVKIPLDVIVGIVKIFLDLVTGHWSKAWHDLLGIFTGIGKTIEGAVRNVFANIVGFVLGSVKTLLDAGLKAGMSIINGIVNGLMAAWHGVNAFFGGIPGKIGAFFVDAAKWLLNAGEQLIMGLIKGAVEAPLKGLEKIGKSIIGKVSGIFHVLSPSKDTEFIGKGLVDGITQGMKNTAADVSQFTKVFDKIMPALKQLTTDMATILKNGMGPAGLAVAGFGTAVVQGIDKALTPALAEVKKFGVELTNDIETPLVKAVKAVGSFGISFLSGFKALADALAIAKAWGPQIKGALGNVEISVNECLLKLEVDALTAGKAIMLALAKGMTQGASAIKTALSSVAVSLAVVSSAADKSGTGHAEVSALKTLVDNNKLGFTQLTTVSRLTQMQLSSILEREVAGMTSLIALTHGSFTTLTNDITRCLSAEDATLVSMLSVDRLALNESRQQTVLLKRIALDLEKPQTVVVKPTPGTPSTATPKAGASSLASAIL